MESDAGACGISSPCINAGASMPLVVMGFHRDSLRPEAENLFTVVALGLNWRDKWALINAAGSCTSVGDPPSPLPSRAGSRQDAERERERILEKFRQGCHPDSWSTSLRLEVWTLGPEADAWDSGPYESFP